MFWQNVGRRSVWRDLERLQREMNRIVEGAGNGMRSEFPPLNIWANDENAMITAEVPGIDVNELDISVVGDTVTLVGSRSEAQDDTESTYHRRERWQGKFSRTVQLPFRINVDRVDATYSNGILHVILPRAEADKPQRISISPN
jgi:HSP20 family protein